MKAKRKRGGGSMKGWDYTTGIIFQGNCMHCVWREVYYMMAFSRDKICSCAVLFAVCDAGCGGSIISLYVCFHCSKMWRIIPVIIEACDIPKTWWDSCTECCRHFNVVSSICPLYCLNQNPCRRIYSHLVPFLFNSKWQPHLRFKILAKPQCLNRRTKGIAQKYIASYTRI